MKISNFISCSGLMLATVGVLGNAVVANAAVLVALQNQEVAVPVNAELGSIFELPSAVKTITPAKYFTISDLGVDLGANGGVGKDVRTFQVKPTKGSHPESVTFVLAGGKSIALRLTAASGAEKFYEVQFDGKKGISSQKFLTNEMSLMRAMLLDENGGFVREIVDTKVSVASFTDLEFSLARIYWATDLTGYVFRIRNKGKTAATISASNFVLGKPNRAILAQADKDRIEPCPFLKTTPECVTALRFVLRGTKVAEPFLGVVPNANPPFVKPEITIEGGVQ